MAVNDYIVVGGGIIGLSTAMHLTRRFPGASVRVLEKESEVAMHQTGRNSGVIHSGIYYKPGSYKARFCQAGASSMVDFCRTHGLKYEVCGKLIVAVDESEILGLERLYERGLANGVPVERISKEEAAEIEPHLQCVAALRVKSTGITSYRAVCREYLRQIQEAGGEVCFDTRVKGIHHEGGESLVETNRGVFRTRFLINCAGLHSDRVAKRAGADPDAQIVPFRGEYFELAPSKRGLVKHLIYPVPNPQFPFLGVHFTRMIDGSVHAGPNAVLAFAREGYFKSQINIRDLTETLTFPGFWKLAMRHMDEGFKEMVRSVSKAAFTKSLQRLIPSVESDDLVPCKSGIRAQALTRDGGLVDDFLIIEGERTMHVCNAPSPAATASLEIGKEIVSRVIK